MDLNTKFSGFVKYFVPEREQGNAVLFRMARARILIFIITGLLYWSYIPHAISINFKYQEWVNLVSGAICIGAAFLYRSGKSKELCGYTYIIGAMGAAYLQVIGSGGINGMLTPLLLGPVTMMLVAGKRPATIMLIITMLFLVFLQYAQLHNLELPDWFDDRHRNRFMLSGFIGMSIAIFINTLVFEIEKNHAFDSLVEKNEDLNKEKEKSELLLLNILPAEIADELKEKGNSQAKQYDEVSVLFTDFVSFTETAESLSPEKLVQELHECFTAFDNIIESNGLEKIKTIGDAYLAVCGLPVSNPLHAQRTVQAALEIRDFIEERNKKEKVFEIRIGVNSGSVVAGIVGVKKFAYDIWGDTVNTAARMESSGESGKVNISETTYQLVKDDFDCTHRGRIEAKGKGAVDMYFVSEKRIVKS